MKFSEAMSKFTDFTFREIIMQNFAYKLIIEGQWVVDSFLKIIVENYQIRLGPHFQQYLPIHELYLISLGTNLDYSKRELISGLNTSNNILKELGLQRKENESISMGKCQTLVRIVNKLIKRQVDGSSLSQG